MSIRAGVTERGLPPATPRLREPFPRHGIRPPRVCRRGCRILRCVSWSGGGPAPMRSSPALTCRSSSSWAGSWAFAGLSSQV
eukprot:1083162-Lingulodinium_polyedra.AAC.1